MKEDDIHYFVINIPQHKDYCNKMEKKPERQEICRKLTHKSLKSEDTSEICVKKFTLPSASPLPASKMRNDYLLLSYKSYLKKEHKDTLEKRLATSSHVTYKIVSTDLKRRSNIKHSLCDVRSVVNKDKDFYTLVNDNRVQPVKHIYKSFKWFLNDHLSLRQNIGSRKDCVLNIETNQRNESDVYDFSSQLLNDQINYFDNFISEDYQKSMVLLEKWNKLKIQVDTVISKLENLASEKFTLMSILIGLDYRYSVQQKYGRFLYYLSPPSWRLKNREFARSVEIEAKGFDLGISSDEDTFNVIFEKLRSECYGNLVKPALYFSQSNHLLDIFNALEKQQLHHFTHVTHFTPYAKRLKDSIKSFKGLINYDSAIVENVIKKFEYLLHLTETRCRFLKEKFFKILNGFFYENVGEVNVLKLTLHLQFCYEIIYNERPTNITIKGIAKALELLYMDYAKKLDTLRSSKVRRAVSICIKTEKEKVRKAEVASKELRLFYRLERELLRAHGLQAKLSLLPSEKQTERNKYSKLQSNPRNKVWQSQMLTDAEKEYLTLFTTWTENDDPTHFLQSFSIASVRKT